MVGRILFEAPLSTAQEWLLSLEIVGVPKWKGLPVYRNKIETVLLQETIRLHELYNLPYDYSMPSIPRQVVSFSKLMSIDPNSFKGKSVLEIGPYRTATAFLFRRLGASKITIIDGDISDLDIMKKIYKREQVDFHQFNLNEFTDYSSRPMPTGNDLVVCMEVVEHLNFNPIPFLRWLRSLVTPDGKLFLTVPNQASLLNKVRLSLGKSIATPISYFIEQMQPGNMKMHGVHWREYVLDEFRDLLTFCGFRELASGYIGMQDYKRTNETLKNIGRKVLTFRSTIFYMGSPANDA